LDKNIKIMTSICTLFNMWSSINSIKRYGFSVHLVVPALKYGALFNASIPMSNSQIYLSKYSYFQTWNNILKDLLCTHNPKKIILYTNTRDTHHYTKHSLLFQKFCEENSILLYTKYFESENEVVPHTVHFPDTWLSHLYST
jgi:hypothetical protein